MRNRIHLNVTLLAMLLAVAPAVAAHEPAAVASGQALHKEQKPWGIAGDEKAVARTVTVRMGDNMRFLPDRIVLQQGETIRFSVQNRGEVLHEFVLGTKKELEAHAALMRKFPGMEHDEPYMAHVGAGKQAGMIWQFNRPGTFHFACLIPGHYEAGMTGTIIVTASAGRKPAAH